GDDMSELAVRGDAELHIDIGKAEIAVEQQDAAPGLGQRVGEGDRKPGLSDPALARSDRDDVAAVLRAVGERARRGIELGGLCHATPLGKSKRARSIGENASSPSAISGAMPASARPRLRRWPTLNTAPSRRTASSRVAIARAQPRSRNMSAMARVSARSRPRALRRAPAGHRRSRTAFPGYWRRLRAGPHRRRAPDRSK